MRKIFIIILSSISFVFGTLVSPSDGDELNYVYVPFEWDQEPDAIYNNLQKNNLEWVSSLYISMYPLRLTP